MSSIVKEYFDTVKAVYFKVIKQECYLYDGKARETIPGFEFWTYTRASDTDEWTLFEISEWEPRQ